MKKSLLAPLMVGLMTLGLGTEARADVDYEGTILYHNDVLDFNFTLTDPSNVRIFTSSFDDGGFDPMLTLWDGSGNYLDFNDDNPYGSGFADSNGVGYDFGGWDSFIETVLGPGFYSVSLTAYDNYPTTWANRADGFAYDSAMPISITSWDAGSGYVASSGDYELHITSNPVPEPASMLLFGSGLAALAGVRRIRRPQVTSDSV